MSHERTSTSVTDESSPFLDVLREAPLSGNRQPRSILGALIYCLLLAGYAAVTIASPWVFFYVPRLIPALICSCNVLLLVITAVFQQYWVYQVRKVRLQGYYAFSQKLKRIARFPFVTISCGNALMLLILVWEHYLHVVSLSLMLRIAVVAEALCAGCIMSLYIGCIHKYNSLNGEPDILRSLYSAIQPSSALEGLRYYDAGSLSDQQMALLQYQRENLHYLSEEIYLQPDMDSIPNPVPQKTTGFITKFVLRLQECLSKYQRSYDGNAPQVDLAHLLASRDQELRALSAEMNQVQSDLRVARSVIAERDAENMRIRSLNNQYVDENERLRGILGEWSARAAKLERALEAERSSNALLRKNSTPRSQ